MCIKENLIAIIKQLQVDIIEGAVFFTDKNGPRANFCQPKVDLQ